MAPSTTRKSRATLVTPESVEQAKEFLQTLPEKAKDDFSLKEAVGRLHDSLKDALSKGYTYDELAAMLTKQGMKISAFTLKSYIPLGKRSSTSGKGRRSSKSKDAAEQLELSEIAPDIPPTASEEAAPAEAPKRGRRPKAASTAPATRAAAKKTTATKTAAKTPSTRKRQS